MTVLVLCNIGARDVLLDGQAIAPARTEGQRLLDVYPDVAPRLTFPIIHPCLRYIVSQHPAGVSRLVLFGTDQPDPAYQPSDTLYFADLAARRLPELWPGQVSQTQPIRVQGINPALYDETFEKFDELLAGLPWEREGVCYVILCGGVPACNTALLLQGVRHYGDNLRVVYQPQKGEPQELRAGRQVMDAFREAAVIEHLEQLDFANALPRLERLGVEPGLVGLVAYAAQRFSFDFRAAQATLEQALRDGDRDTREFITAHLSAPLQHRWQKGGAGLRHDLDPLLTAEQAGQDRLLALLRELYWNAAITYQHRRHADFLGRIYRFQEAVLRYLVERVYGLPTDLNPAVREDAQRRWREGIAANAALRTFLESQTIEDKPLDWQTIGRSTYKALLGYAADERRGLDAAGQPLLPPQKRGWFAALLDRVNGFDPLVELRHRTIIGHDFEGVSEALILAHYKGSRKPDGSRRTPVEGLAEIMGMLDIDVRESPYQAVAEFVIHRLHRR